MTKFTLRPYQKEAVAATIKYFKHHSSSAVIVLPTGAGKSLVIAQLAALANYRVLVLAHVKELVQQNQQKFQSYGLASSVFSAGLKQRDNRAKVVFASVQSVSRNLDHFNQQYSLLIIDECHRLSDDENSAYHKVIKQLRDINPALKVLGLTATPYRLGSGWIYQYHHRGFARRDTASVFRDCIYELALSYMIKHKFLTPPKIYDAAVAEYDFSQVAGFDSGHCSSKALNNLLLDNQRVTKTIIDQVIHLSSARKGVMIFAATVKHAQEIYSYLPRSQSALIIGDTAPDDRDRYIDEFKTQSIKYLVNVSVLTTGFDAPHVDVIALLRPTQSVSLFQQIVGRGLRLCEHKENCLVLDYTGSKFNIFHPEVGELKPDTDSQPVQIFCPQCDFANIFWGKLDDNGEIIEHYGRRCQALIKQDSATADGLLEVEGSTKAIPELRCQFRFRFKNCPNCNAENDIAARECLSCEHPIVDPDEQLKKALQLKDAKVIRCAGMTFCEKNNKLKITYHDEQGETLSEYFDTHNTRQMAIFDRLYSQRLAAQYRSSKASQLATILIDAKHYTAPDFVIARKNGHFWKVADRIFDYQGNYRRANQL